VERRQQMVWNEYGCGTKTMSPGAGPPGLGPGGPTPLRLIPLVMARPPGPDTHNEGCGGPSRPFYLAEHISINIWLISRRDAPSDFFNFKFSCISEMFISRARAKFLFWYISPRGRAITRGNGGVARGPSHNDG